MRTLYVNRLYTSGDPTLGFVTVDTLDAPPICFSLEDRFRAKKLRGDTRIPAGRYQLKWREIGKWALRFKKAGFPGSLEICDVPEFTDVLIHVGNTKGDTEGCVLLGMGMDLDTHTITKSKIACNKLYSAIYNSPDEDWWIILRSM